VLWNSDLVPWLSWIFPAVGAVLALGLAKFSRKVRDVIVVLFSFLGWLMTAFMLPDLPSARAVDKSAFWFILPNNVKVSMGMLVDPLSIIIANIVAFLGLLILVYSSKYVENDASATRYWFFMSLFMSGMLLLVMADNLILFFIGWKIVGLCSFGLISYYYSDEKEHWIGGPSPFTFWKPSKCGLKALLVTTFGDISLLAGILVLFLYSGTFNFMDLFNTASHWLPEMAATPGILALTAVLILLGPFAKSAQFPFQEWLPEAMAGPTPVSALIHAATMVKAGVYLVARVLPIFFFACWVATPNFPEALVFFVLVAVVGGFTLFLGASQALVAKELKKALAYSTMSSIGYMMLALGVSGMSAGTLVDGLSAGIFFLINHGIFKAALFLGAGVIIHESGSIYMSDMKLSRQKMRFTWLFMWLAGLSLMGVPPFAGFWSKDDVLISCWQAGQYGLFALALVSVILTAFYVIRFMGIMFNSKQQPLKTGETHGEETSALELVPLGLLAGLTVAIGLIGPWFSAFLSNVFKTYFMQSLSHPLITVTSATVSASSNTMLLEVAVAAGSTLMILIGLIPSYRFFISQRLSAESIISKHPILKSMYSFLWNRWYVETFYNKVFVDGGLAAKDFANRFIERPLDLALNVGVPSGFAWLHRGLKKVQTGILSVNMLYFIGLIIIVLLIFLLLGVL
jgi:NADH-quinone oxidoreductase subunit L